MGRGLHVLMGARFEHAHAQCPTCRHRSDEGGVRGFDGYCLKKEKTLCCSTRARCRAYEPKETPMSGDSSKHPLEQLQPKPRTTVKRFAADLKARIERAAVAFDQPGQDERVAGMRYVLGIVDAALSDYDSSLRASRYRDGT